MHTDQLTVEGSDYTRMVRIVPGPRDAAHPLCVFLDGEYYLERMGALSILEKSIAGGRIPDMSYVFVPSNGPQSRHEDLVCNERYARFVSEEVVAAARSRVETIRDDGHLICGLSLSGLASAHIALTYPQLFPSALSQSGSFWWSRRRFASLVESIAEIRSRHWLSVGDEETVERATHPPTGMIQECSQIAGVQSAVDALRARGAEVTHHVYKGGHAFEPWADELSDALSWLVGGRLLEAEV